MAAVYILFSIRLKNYYIGSCLNLGERLAEHKSKVYKDSYTSKVNYWELYYNLEELEYHQARAIEKHIKKMKSKKYIENLKKYKEISFKLIDLYKEENKLSK